MGDFNNIVVAFCGFGTVCCGAFLVALFVLFRVTGRSMLLPAFSALLSVLKRRDNDNDDDLDMPRKSSRSTTSARDRIQRTLQSADQDFQQALRQKGGQSTGTPPKPQERNFSTNGIGDSKDIPSLRRRRRDENDAVGYDEDDDGLIDF